MDTERKEKGLVPWTWVGGSEWCAGKPAPTDSYCTSAAPLFHMHLTLVWTVSPYPCPWAGSGAADALGGLDDPRGTGSGGRADGESSDGAAAGPSSVEEKDEFKSLAKEERLAREAKARAAAARKRVSRGCRAEMRRRGSCELSPLWCKGTRKAGEQMANARHVGSHMACIGGKGKGKQKPVQHPEFARDHRNLMWA